MHRLALALWCVSLVASAGTAELSWTAPTQNVDGTPITLPLEYRLWRTCDGGPTAQVVQTPALAYNDIVEAQTCSWWVSAVTADGESARTGPVSKTFGVELPGAVSATFSWTTTEQGPSSMALSFSSLDSGEETGSDGTIVTASVSPPDSAVVYLSVATTNPSTYPTAPTWAAISDTFGSVTWTFLVQERYSDRRWVSAWRGVKSGAWGTGTITVQRTGGSSLQDMAWVVDAVAGADLADPDDTPVQGDTASGTLTLADVGTVDSGDAVYVIGAHENGANNFQCTGYTGITTLGSLSNVRQIRTWYDDSTPDETPELTNDGGGSGTGGIAFVVNAGAGGAVASLPPINPSARMAAMIAH